MVNIAYSTVSPFLPLEKIKRQQKTSNNQKTFQLKYTWTRLTQQKIVNQHICLSSMVVSGHIKINYILSAKRGHAPKTTS